MQHFNIIKDGETIDTVERKLHTDYDDNNYINYNGETYEVDHFYPEPVVNLDDGPFEPVIQYKKCITDDREIAHLWAHQVQKEAYKPNYSFYFEGKSIYSYGSHFEIARLVDVPHEDNPVVLFNNQTYSMSTSVHQNAVRSAIPDDYKTFKANFSGGYYSMNAIGMFEYDTNEENRDAYRQFVLWHLKQMDEVAESMKRRQKLSTFKPDARSYRWHQRQIHDFIETFKCKSVFTQTELRKVDAPAFDDFSEWMQKARKWLTYEERAEKRRLEKLQHKLDHYVPRLPDLIKSLKENDAMDPITFWKEHGTYVMVEPEFKNDLSFWSDNPHRFEEETGMELPQVGRFQAWNADAYVRWDEKRQRFETSKSANVSYDNVRLALITYDRHVSEGMEKSTGTDDFVGINGRMNLGGFGSVPHVNSEGDFRYGCHVVRKDEVEATRKLFKSVEPQTKPATAHEYTI